MGKKISNPFSSIHIKAPKLDTKALNGFVNFTKEAKSDVVGVAQFGKSIALAPLNAFTDLGKTLLGGQSSLLLPILAIGGCIIAYGIISKKF